jgi:hypothetical protein
VEETKMGLFGYRKYLVELYASQGRQYQKVKNERGVETVSVKQEGWEHFEKSKEESS